MIRSVDSLNTKITRVCCMYSEQLGYLHVSTRSCRKEAAQQHTLMYEYCADPGHPAPGASQGAVNFTGQWTSPKTAQRHYVESVQSTIFSCDTILSPLTRLPGERCVCKFRFALTFSLSFIERSSPWVGETGQYYCVQHWFHLFSWKMYET